MQLVLRFCAPRLRRAHLVRRGGREVPCARRGLVWDYPRRGVVLDFLERLERRLTVSRAQAVLALEAARVELLALGLAGLQVEREALLIADRVERGDVRAQIAEISAVGCAVIVQLLQRR